MNEQTFLLEGTILMKYLGEGGEVIIPDGITEIGQGAFSGNQTVTAVTLPGSVTRIEYGAFAKCAALERVYIADGVTFFHNCVFQDCASLREVRLPGDAANLGKFMFQNCTALESVELPAMLESVPDSMFQNCTALKEITIPDKVHTLWKAAFAGCTSLEKVHFGASVRSLWNMVFAGCTALREITVSPDNEHYSTGDRVLLSKDGKKLELALPGLAGEYTVQDGVETVKSAAFMGCNGLTAIRFAPSVKSIDYMAFQNCENLVSVIIPATVKELGFSAFEKQARWGQPAPKPIEELIVALDACETVASGIWLGAGDEPVCHPQLPFQYAGTKEDKQRLALGYILNSEKYTEAYAKGYMKYVKSQRKGLIALAQKKHIKGVEEFYAALDAKPGAKPKKEAPAPTPVAAPGATPNEAQEFEIADGLLVKYLGDARTVTLPETVERIGEKAFCGCKKLEKVVLPQSVKHVEKKAFVTCPKLKTVVIFGSEITLDFNFYKFRETLDVVAPNLSPAVFPAANRIQSVVSLAHAVAEGTVDKPAGNSKVAGYLKRSNHQFFPLVQKDEALLDLMIGYNAITGKEVPELLELWKDITPEQKLKLLELTKGEKAPTEKLETALTGKGPTVAELKKDWTYSSVIFDKSWTGTETIKGVTIRKYKGFRSDVEIPAYIGKNPVLQVDAGAFRDNAQITSVKLPETVISVADSAFDGCRKLERVEHFGQELRLGSNVFNNCSALASFSTTAAKFQNGIHPFRGCDKLFDANGFIILDIGGDKVLVEVKMPITTPEIRIPDGVTQIGSYALGERFGDMGQFNGKLERVILPDTVRQVCGSAFSGAGALRQVNLPEGLVSIGQMAFSGCGSLERLYIPVTATEVNASAFFRCEKLTIHGETGSAAETAAGQAKRPFKAGKF